MANCQSCDAPVIWTMLLKQDGEFSDKPHPMNATPLEQTNGLNGAYALVKRRDGSVPMAIPAVALDILMSRSIQDVEVALYDSHFASCPNAAHHRRG